MSEERTKVFRRFQERLAQLEAGLHREPIHHKVYHLQNALNALETDHSLADLHLDEFDRAEIEREMPELAADRVPTVEELRSRFDMVAGGML
jgi:hypothetical protein